MATNSVDFAAELKEQLDRAKDPKQMAGLAVDLASIIPLDSHIMGELQFDGEMQKAVQSKIDLASVIHLDHHTLAELQFDEKFQAEVKKNVEQRAALAPVAEQDELVFDLGGLSEDGLSLFDIDAPKPVVTIEESKEALPAALPLAPAPSELVPLVENDALLQKITDLESALETQMGNNKVLGQSLNETIDSAQKANQVYQGKEKELQEQIAKLQEQSTKLQELSAKLQEQSAKLQEQSAKLQEMLSGKDKILAQKEAELAATTQDIQAERERVKKLQSDVKELEKAYQMLEDAEGRELESSTNLVAEKKKGQELAETNKLLKETEEKLKAELLGLKSSRASTQILHLGDLTGVSTVRLHYSVDEATVRQGLPVPNTATDLKVTLPLFTTLQSLKPDDEKEHVKTKAAKP